MHLALLTEPRYLKAAPPDADAATAAYYANIHREDALLSAALAVHGVRTTRVDWSDLRVDWSSFDAGIFRTTWDYFERIEEFRVWLAQVEGRLPLLNSGNIVRWNLDKHYLLELQRAGLDVVPTFVAHRGTHAALSELLTTFGWTEGIAKPAISGAARHTWRARAGDTTTDARFDALVFEEDMLVQPFVPSVLERGEVSVMVFGGRATHAVQKVPKRGDFRVQDDHGGSVHPYVATDRERTFAERAVAIATELVGAPVYARVDIVDLNGAPALMELELIEPELFMREAPSSADVFAGAVVAALG